MNQDIYLVPLSYMPVERGIEKVFARRRKEDPQKNAGGGEIESSVNEKPFIIIPTG